MTVRWAPLWLACAMAAATAACGPLPQPFRHDDGEIAQLARPKLERGVTLRLGSDVPQADALTEQLLKSFDDLEIPLSLREGPAAKSPRDGGNGFGRVLAVTVEGGQLVWRLRDGDGQDLARLPRPLPVTASAASRQAAEIAPQIASHLDDPDAKGAPTSRPKAPAASRPRVRIEPLRGLPGNGDQALAAALAAALSRRGVDIAENAPVTIVGQIAVAPAPARPGAPPPAPGNEQDILQVAWLVKAGNAAGRQLARLDQSGPVPRGRLNQPWGALAGDIAEGSALDLAKVLRLAAETLAEPPPPPPSEAQPKPFTETGPADIGRPNSKDPAITATPGPAAATALPPRSGQTGGGVAAKAKAPAAKTKDMKTSKSSHPQARKPHAGQHPAPAPKPKVPSAPSSRSHPDR